jgi:hypothetical protein
VLASSALAALAGGCEGTMMSAGVTRVPLLVGPVACIGCAPAPAPAWNGRPFADDVYFRGMFAGGATGTMWSEEWKRPTLGPNADRVVRNPCVAQLHVSKIAASSFGVGALLFWMHSVAIEVEATPARVPNGSCGQPPAPPSTTLPPEPEPEEDDQ